MAWHWTGDIWTNDGLFHWCIHVPLSLNELKIIISTKFTVYIVVVISGRLRDHKNTTTPNNIHSIINYHIVLAGTEFYNMLHIVLLIYKQLSFFYLNMILVSWVVRSKGNVFVLIWSSIINAKLALWILMPWCFSTRPSVTTMLSVHPCISRCLWVKVLVVKYIPIDIFMTGILMVVVVSNIMLTSQQ